MAPVDVIGARVRSRRRLADARALVPRIVASDPAVLAACGPAAVIARAELTSTDVAVILVSPPGRPPGAVLKLPMTPQAVAGMGRESRALAALHADERLDDWRGLIPRARASGTLDGQRYRVDSVLRGRSMLDRLQDEASRNRLLESAAQTIHVLHRTSATVVDDDDLLAQRWVDAPVDDLLAHGGARGLEPRLHRLREELRGALSGRSVAAGWIHGDYWLGNLLFERSEERPSGIADWDAAAEVGLPIMDILHLLLYARRSSSGADLGEILRELLRDGEWSATERRVLAGYGTWCCEESLSRRHVLLLYWLRHVAHHASQQGLHDGVAYRRWQNKNVRPILASA
jgi:aminoglycoside phosphotransferase (APT) family kinase protein